MKDRLIALTNELSEMRDRDFSKESLRSRITVESRILSIRCELAEAKGANPSYVSLIEETDKLARGIQVNVQTPIAVVESTAAPKDEKHVGLLARLGEGKLTAEDITVITSALSTSAPTVESVPKVDFDALQVKFNESLTLTKSLRDMVQESTAFKKKYEAAVEIIDQQSVMLRESRKAPVKSPREAVLETVIANLQTQMNAVPPKEPTTPVATSMSESTRHELGRQGLPGLNKTKVSEGKSAETPATVVDESVRLATGALQRLNLK